MVWQTRQGVQKSPSTYSADIDDSDNDSYTSIEDGSLIDNPVVVGMLKLSMEFDCATEEEAEEILSRTWENPLIATVKVPVVAGGILENVKFRVSKRHIDCIITDKGMETEHTLWKASFNLMQKEITEAQKQAVKEANM